MHFHRTSSNGQPQAQSGFTLIELSVVLVIVGLLIGGLLSGQTLIRAAEIRSIATQFTVFNTSAQNFRMKYKAIPGDMTNATTYWGAAHATPSHKPRRRQCPWSSASSPSQHGGTGISSWGAAAPATRPVRGSMLPPDCASTAGSAPAAGCSLTRARECGRPSHRPSARASANSAASAVIERSER
mgnify:CR=1 FL=1